jgi:hypothetical protein
MPVQAKVNKTLPAKAALYSDKAAAACPYDGFELSIIGGMKTIISDIRKLKPTPRNTITANRLEAILGMSATKAKPKLTIA